jgi:hypothetical protein
MPGTGKLLPDIMGVTIYQVEKIDGNLHLQAKISTKADFVLLESLFRDLIAAHLCIHTSFGLDKAYNVATVFDYPCRKILTLIYKSSSGTVGLSPFKSPPINAANRRALRAELNEAAKGSGGGKRPAARRRTKGKKEEPPAEQ